MLQRTNHHSRIARASFWLFALGLTVGLLASPTARAATPTELAAAKAKLIGYWETAPALDEDVLQMDPNEKLAYARAQAIGVRMMYFFSADGTVQINILSRVGPQNGTQVDTLAPKKISGTWSVRDCDAKTVKIQITRSGGKPSDVTLIWDGNDSFSTDVFDLMQMSFRSPFVFHRNVGDVVIKWLVKNAVGGAKSPKVEELAEQTSKFVNSGEDFTFRIGSGLLKSGRPTEIHGFYDQFFAFELSDVQAGQLDVGKQELSGRHSPRTDMYPVLTEARITKVDFEKAQPLDLGAPIKAKVTVAAIHTLADGIYSVRLTLQTKDGNISMYQPLPRAPIAEATFNCEFKPAAKYADYTGPVAVFVDFTRQTKFQQGLFSIEVLSQAKGFLMDAASVKGAGADPKPSGSSLDK